jgi:regulator of RNase E activity RraB
MGMEYKLIKPNKLELYNLDKGNWDYIFKQNCCFKMKYTFNKTEDLIKARKGSVSYFRDDNKWAEKVAKDIIAWCGNDIVIMINDCNEIYDDWNIWQTYNESGNRFQDNEDLDDNFKGRYKERENNK